MAIAPERGEPAERLGDVAFGALRDAAAMLLRDADAAHLETALAAIPQELATSGPARAMRAELLRRRGDVAAASALFAEALDGCPDLLPAYHCAALAKVALRDLPGARTLWTALLERAPDDAAARYQIGLTWHDAGEPDEAARWYERQLERHPRSFPAAYNLGLIQMERNDPAKAAAAFERATGIDATQTRAWMALGTAQRRQREFLAAADSFRRAHGLEPANVRALAQAAEALGEAAELPAAIELLDHAIAIDPADASLHWARGVHLANLGLHEQALASFRRARELDPANARGESALLLEMQYDTAASTRADLARAHWEWADQHSRRPDAIAEMRHVRQSSDRRIRIGYVSPRFGHGPLASFFLPVLEAHDRTRFHVALYSAYRHDDDISARMRAASDTWRDLPSDDDAAATLIAADDLDLLIDLAGHAPGNRLNVFARKPAPVEATWLDYFDTTGVPEIDYVLTDSIQTPAGDAPLFRERLVWLPRCRFVYRPIVPPRSSPPPCRAKGFVTFGSFNRHAKITDDVLALWREVLAAVPDSRLVLRATAYNGQGTVHWLRERWARSGLPVERIEFGPYLPLREAIDAYRSVDVALDTFPYNGGVTTCDALSMGVPVVALLGERMIARQSAALLRAAGHPEWVAGMPGEYVRIAVDLARRVLAEDLRGELFRSFPGTPLCDVPRFVTGLERAFIALIDTGPRHLDASVAPPLQIPG